MSQPSRTSRARTCFCVLLALAFAPMLATAPHASASKLSTQNQERAKLLAQLEQVSLPDLRARLEALDPRFPLEYIKLAEELSQERTFGQGAPPPVFIRDLSARLYVLAFELTRESQSTSDIARSALLGLASIMRTEADRRWLLAIADQFPPRVERSLRTPARITFAVDDQWEQAAANLTTAMALARSGNGRQAERILKRPGVRALLEQSANLMSGSAQSNPSKELDGWIEQWPRCQTCQNRRFISRSASDQRLCPNCEGTPGPNLSDADRINQYRAEAFLLRGIHRSWGAQLLVDSGRPLREPDPNEVARQLGIVPKENTFRDGAWVKP